MTTRARWATRSAELPLLDQLPSLQTRGLQQLQLRAADSEDGTFDGYACVWDVIDSYGTTFRRGSFIEGGLDQGEYALLWMHDPTQPIGVFTATEDDHGLVIKGAWDQTPEGQAKRVMARGSAPGLSVGFVPVGVDPDDPSVFTSARLVETSQITLRMASVPGAELTAARQRQLVSDAEAAKRQSDVDRVIAQLRLTVSPMRL